MNSFLKWEFFVLWYLNSRQILHEIQVFLSPRYGRQSSCRSTLTDHYWIIKVNQTVVKWGIFRSSGTQNFSQVNFQGSFCLVIIASLFQQDSSLLKYGNVWLFSCHYRIQSHGEGMLIPWMPVLLLVALELSNTIEIF